jgi:hypothetical protein
VRVLLVFAVASSLLACRSAPADAAAAQLSLRVAGFVKASGIT